MKVKLLCIPAFLLFISHHAFAQSTRIGLFNIKELSTEKLKQVDENGVGQNQQLHAAASIIKEINPDILVINEIDHDYDAADSLIFTINAQRFKKSYLRDSEYKYIFAAPCNTGLLSGFDLNNDGLTATQENLGTREYGDDCYGWGMYPGQYAMAVLSKKPILFNGVRTFQKFLWKNLPGNHLPNEFYSDEEKEILRLSSKSHWDVPVLIGADTLHLLLSHPTPPVFDGPEDRNGRRNFDEIRFWKLYLDGSMALIDDAGNHGGLQRDASFAIVGDLNAAPNNEIAYDDRTAIAQVLTHNLVQESGAYMTSDGAREGMTTGTPDFFEQATTEFRKGMKRRIDYILPASNITMKQGGVYWPEEKKNPALFERAMQASDHRMVWLDLEFGK
ncbi:MAG: endonuclease/exonuclease/phosphatase family protein [Deferribacteres bacterium]|nr:endonuclease/exonuclease/phosphatase family protein [candidate division KSB1 bacterium]MCB9502292.1 endonuclease/exonuclease/phosphatase family protein [Deferribacteres bacterium]